MHSTIFSGNQHNGAVSSIFKSSSVPHKLFPDYSVINVIKIQSSFQQATTL